MRIGLMLLGAWVLASLLAGLVYCFAAQRGYQRGLDEALRSARTRDAEDHDGAYSEQGAGVGAAR